MDKVLKDVKKCSHTKCKNEVIESINSDCEFKKSIFSDKKTQKRTEKTKKASAKKLSDCQESKCATETKKLQTTIMKMFSSTKSKTKPAKSAK